MNDFLWDSPIYQEFVGEIRAEAKAEERAEVLSSKQQELDEQLLDLVDTRFPVLLDLANKCVGKINDTSILIRLLGKVGAAQTEQDAKKVLKSYLNEH